MFNLPWRTHNLLIPQICHDIPMRFILHSRFLHFIKSSVSSQNSIIRFCGLLALHGSQSPASNSITIASLHRFYKYDLTICPRLNFAYSDADQRNSELILDILNMDNSGTPFFSRIERFDLLHFLCTS